jgi:hypothetical protein
MDHFDLRKVRQLDDLCEELESCSAKQVEVSLGFRKIYIRPTHIMACEATIAARMATTRLNIRQPGGAVWKTGYAYLVSINILGNSLVKLITYADGITARYAAWPMYANSRHGNVQQSQLICIALMLKAP